jgi:hypothetical protein
MECAVRRLVPYLLIGILVVLALDVTERVAGLGMAVGAQPVAEDGVLTQYVDRTHKGDRLPLPTEIGRQQTPRAPNRVLIGCEPTFSPLSSMARVITPGRCIA